MDLIASALSNSGDMPNSLRAYPNHVNSITPSMHFLRFNFIPWYRHSSNTLSSSFSISWCVVAAAIKSST